MSPQISPWPDEASPSLPHLAGEFLLWLWWKSDTQGNRLDLGEDRGPLELWVDTRLAFRSPSEDKAAAILTGENPAASREARAAILGGKVLNEIRLGMRREEREFYVTIKAPDLDLAALQLPQVVKGEGEEAIYDRMFLYEEVHGWVAALFVSFIQDRTLPEWDTATLPAIRAWVQVVGEGGYISDDDPDEDASSGDLPPWEEEGG